MYHCSNTCASLMRKSAPKSITRTPAANNSGACAIATPCGVAKNTTSQVSSKPLFGSLKHKSTTPRKLGNICATGKPASEREVMAINCTLGCWLKILSNSTPVYPVPPTIPTLIFCMIFPSINTSTPHIPKRYQTTKQNERITKKTAQSGLFSLFQRVIE